MTASRTPPAPSSTCTISSRFTGPLAGWANGGVIVGTLAAHLPPGPVTVRIERPVPVDAALEVSPVEAGIELFRADERLATATPGELDPSLLPDPVELDEAEGTTPVVAAATHPAARCFVCGPAHPAGLDLQPGPVEGRSVLATTWQVAADLSDSPTGVVPVPVVVAGLDCPGWYAGFGGEPALLGTMTVDVRRPVGVGDLLVVTAHTLGRKGRKVEVATALRTPDGTLVAGATATWISTPDLASIEGPTR